MILAAGSGPAGAKGTEASGVELGGLGTTALLGECSEDAILFGASDVELEKSRARQDWMGNVQLALAGNYCASRHFC